MNTISLRRLSFLFALLCASVLVQAAEHPAALAAASAVQSMPAQSSDPAAKDEVAADAGSQDDFVESNPAQQHAKHHLHHRGSGSGNDVVSVGHNSHLAAGEKADSVVSVFGSSTSEGEADDVVSVLGNTRITGLTHGDAVAVLGNLYIDSKVEGDAVSVLGSVQLGPHAEVEGDVTSALGAVHRTPDSIVHGSVRNVSFGEFSDMDWLQTWVHECLFEARPLAFVAGIQWAWVLAFLFLAFYVFLALVFRRGVSQCVATLETQPGHTALAALLAMLLTPVLLVLLCVTVIGIAAVPFVMLSLFCIGLFGKAVILAWMGHRVIGHRPGGSHPALAVLIGGAIALVLYVIPVVGLLAYKLLGFFGFGAVVYTLVLGQRARQAARAERAAAGQFESAGSSAAPAAAAAASAGTAFASPGNAPNPEAAYAASTGAAAAGAAPSGPAPTDARTDLPPQVLAALPRAGFWVRMGALLIDVLLVGFLSSFVFGSFHHHESNLHLLVLAIYGACMWKLRGSTVGGIVCDLRVVRADGRPLEWETAIVRALACFLSLAVCGLGFIWIAFDENHQAWHDKIAGTLVVRVPKGRALL
jgi:uncharacterized RDD family membrane protein YckC